MRQLGSHGVVLGAGMAGLFTAGVLADAFDRVSVVERDPVAGSDQPRRGVPQGRHTHALMPGGTTALEQLLPGIVDQVLAAGAVQVEPLVEYRMQVGGHQLRQVPIGSPALQASRPFLESLVRARVERLGVEFLHERDVVGLHTGDRGARIDGVRVMRRAPGSAEEILPADLVVDAMGRGGRTPAWLDSLGYLPPPEERFPVDVGYASQTLQLPREPGFDEKLVGVGPVPGHPRGMMLQAVEGNRHLLTLAGFTGAHRPPADPAGFLRYAATVAPSDVAAAITAAQPTGDIASYRYPAYLRRHYQRLRRFPAGLLVIGDALCSVSPVYAQGMTVAAQEALALRSCLAVGEQGLARRFFRAAAGVVADPWQMAIGADLALPEIPGRRTVAVRARNALVARMLATAEHDEVVARQFMRVLGLLDRPSALTKPAVLHRILRPGAAPAAGTSAVARSVAEVQR